MLLLHFLCYTGCSILSWSQESITIQVNHVIRHICYPHFRIPCKRLREFLEGLEVKECRNKNLAALYILCQYLLYESFCIFAYFLKHHIWLNFICKDSTFHLIIQSFLCFLSFFIFPPSSHTPSCSFCLRNQCLSNGLGRRHKVPSQRKSEGDWSTRHNLPHE